MASGGDVPWKPDSWRSKPAKQQVEYADKALLAGSLEQLRVLPPLISPGEVTNLRAQLAEVAQGKRFLLQGGDCAERFLDCKADSIEKKLRIMMQMSLVLTWGARVPTVRMGRMAGQFAKPRSKPFEEVDGKTYHSYRGDNINSHDLDGRVPDPDRLVKGYFHSAATLNYARALIKDGFADVRSAENWDLGFVKSSRNRAEYEKMVQSILEASEFVEVCGLQDLERLKTVDLFVCHEALHLEYEEALTRPMAKTDGKYFNSGAHFVWIGDRTRQLDHAHIEYFRGLENPIGVKVGPSMRKGELVPLILTVCPNIKEQPGKVTLISRFGADNVETMLPAFIKEVQAAGLQDVVIWCCDPMHGNTDSVTEGSAKGYKTRKFDNVARELQLTFEVHHRCGSRLGGTHLELTGESVTECTGGPEELQTDDLPQRYTTYCDPRLNYAQSLEIAFMISNYLKALKAGKPVVTHTPRKRKLTDEDAAAAGGGGGAAAKKK